MVNGDGAHKDGSVMLSLAIVHPLGTLHTSIGSLRTTELLGPETIRSQVRPDGGHETLDTFDRVVGFANISRSRGSLV